MTVNHLEKNILHVFMKEQIMPKQSDLLYCLLDYRDIVNIIPKPFNQVSYKILVKMTKCRLSVLLL